MIRAFITIIWLPDVYFKLFRAVGQSVMSSPGLWIIIVLGQLKMCMNVRGYFYLSFKNVYSILNTLNYINKETNY